GSTTIPIIAIATLRLNDSLRRLPTRTATFTFVAIGAPFVVLSIGSTRRLASNASNERTYACFSAAGERRVQDRSGRRPRHMDRCARRRREDPHVRGGGRGARQARRALSRAGEDGKVRRGQAYAGDPDPRGRRRLAAATAYSMTASARARID